MLEVSFLSFFIYMCLCLSRYVHVSAGDCKGHREGGIGLPGAGVTGAWAPPHLGVWNWTQVLKDSMVL